MVDGDVVKLSVAPGSCTKDQTPTSLPVSAAGDVVGQKLELTPHTDGKLDSCNILLISATAYFYTQEYLNSKY